MKIELIDNYADEPAKIAKDLEALAYLLGEREEEVYRCTCEDDPDHPRGSWEYDTNAYNHGRECPSSLAYHHRVLLLGLARYFSEPVKERLKRLEEACSSALRELSDLEQHWKNESESFDHPSEAQERQMALDNLASTRRTIALVRAALATD